MLFISKKSNGISYNLSMVGAFEEFEFVDDEDVEVIAEDDSAVEVDD